MDYNKLSEKNIKKLSSNTYPGRGIVIGLSPDSNSIIQVYWIMGRSENSRNRVFIEENGFVRTQAFDHKKLVDPSLIIYYPVKFYNNKHIVSNGDQTDTIYSALRNSETFEKALNKRKFEPDEPNFTPRISGLVDLDDKEPVYSLSILKSMYNNSGICIRNYFNYSGMIEGFGHCIHTYAGDGIPLPSFEGEPCIVRLFDDMDKVAVYYWDILNDDNKVSLLVKFIDKYSGQSKIKIINRNK